MTAEFSAPLHRRQFIKTMGRAAASAAIVTGPLAALGQENQPKLVFALVGAAHIHTPNYIRILKQHKEVMVKYVYDHDHARAQNAATALGGQAVDDDKTIWADPEIRAVVICSETNRHRDLVLAAAAAGKHVFAEKPMGIGSAESYEMAAALAKAHVLFTTGYFQRTASTTQFLKQQVDANVFGKITRVRGSN